MSRAERLRLEGRWDDALAALPDGDDLDTALELRQQMLAILEEDEPDRD